MHEEQAGLIDHMQQAQTFRYGKRTYTQGQLWNRDCVCVLSGIGKVAAAITATTLIERFGVSQIIFTGTAGGIDARLNTGDVVVAEELVQHDMDASPLFPKYEVPLTGVSRFVADTDLGEQLAAAAADFLRTNVHAAVTEDDRRAFGLHAPRLHTGLIASGDRFINGHAERDALIVGLPGLLAIEMEGAAVAQVCFEFDVPFAVVRTISDGANEHAPVNFAKFIERVAAHYTLGIVESFCKGGKV